jgi:hypothetical protein
MKKFLEIYLRIYLGFFITLPAVFFTVLYIVGCFISWSILEPDIEWSYVRLYMVIALIVAFFMSMDE